MLGVPVIDDRRCRGPRANLPNVFPGCSGFITGALEPDREFPLSDGCGALKLLPRDNLKAGCTLRPQHIRKCFGEDDRTRRGITVDGNFSGTVMLQNLVREGGEHILSSGLPSGHDFNDTPSV